MTEVDREALGRMVRDEWIRWAREQPDPKPSWLVPWDDLPEPDREVDRRIGQRLYDQALEQMRARADDESLNPEALWRQVDRQWSVRYRADIRSRDQAITEAVADERQRAVEEIRAAKGEQVRAFGSDPISYLAGRVDGLEDAARILAAGSVPIATPVAPAPALLEPVADAIGQAMTTRQGPPEIAARAMAAAAPSIGGMCHWVQNRGTARAETHQAFHYGSPCPYEAMAAVLRGEPDPRETTDPEAAEPAGGGALQLAAARAEVTDARAALGRLIAADDERHRAMEPGSLGYAQQIAEQCGDLADAADEDGMG